MSNAKAVLFALSVAISSGFSVPARADERLSGTWLTGDGSTRVAFKPCGSADCGEIVWLREPIDPDTGKPWADKFNPDEKLKRKSLVGLAMVTGVIAKAPSAWAGTLYNPLDGNSYTGDFVMLSTDKLRLKGCALAGLICQTEIWMRVE